VSVHLSSISFDQIDHPVPRRLADHLSDAHGRTCPDMEARLFFDADEIRGAQLLTKKKMPAAPPTLNDVVRLIALAGASLGARAMANRELKQSGAAWIRSLRQRRQLRALRDGLG
jgi:hypothetical protein